MDSPIPPQVAGSASSQARTRVVLAAIILFAVFKCLYLWLDMQHSLWDRDEPRYAEATRSMLESGNWVIPYFNGDIRPNKPVLIYWLMSVPMRFLGPTEIGARCIASVAGAFTIVLCFLLAIRLGASFWVATAGAVTIGLSPMLIVVSTASTTDGVLLLWTVAALSIHWRQKQAGFSWVRHGLFWVVVGLSALTKGPPGIAVILSTIVAERVWSTLGHRYRWFPLSGGECEANRAPTWVAAIIRTGFGLAVFLAVVAPWVILVLIREGPSFFITQIRDHAMAHATRPMEGHRGPWIFYYIPVLMIASYAALPLVIAALAWAFGTTRRAEVRFLLCWILPTLLIFGSAGTKLPHYIAPGFIPLALLAAVYLEALRSGAGNDISIWWWRVGSLIVLLIGTALGAGAIFGVRFSGIQELRLPSYFLCAGLVPLAIIAGHFWWRRRILLGLLPGWAAMVVLVAVVGLLAFPAIEPLRPSRLLADWIHRNAPEGTRLIATSYQEPSLVYYYRGQIEMASKSKGLELIEALKAPANTAIIMEKDRWEKSTGIAQDFGIALTPNIRVRHGGRYYQFQKGGWIDLVVVGNW
ncbi:MAG: glycosyltransferase family 39 protein [Candidatus Sumerlaeaceae bacterium]|nr:glycosyltransferase family 39 protein [Candidatus Sumerlaeaceae bacterium]